MSSPFLLGGGGLSLAQLQDGSTPINVSTVTVQGLVPNLPVTTNGTRRLTSRLLGLADLNFSPTTSPFPGSFLAGDFITAYATVPRSVNDLVTEVDAFTGINVGVGSGDVFRARAGPVLAPVLEFRTLAGSADGITVTTGADEVDISCDINGANPSATPGALVFSGKTGADLDFRTLVAGTGITLTQGAPTADDITIDASGFVTTLANIGGGAEVFDALAGTVANLRTLVGSANGLAVTQNATTIDIDNTLTGANLGAGSQVFSAKVGAALDFRSIVAGSNIAVTQAANTITVAYAPPPAIPDELKVPGVSELWGATTGVVASNTCAVSLRPTFDRWLLSGAGSGVRYSNDGFATAATGLAAAELYVTAWADTLGRAVARSYNAVPPTCHTSADGVTWTPQVAPSARAIGTQHCITWTGSLFVCCVVTAFTVQTSPDGITWTDRSTGARNVWAVVSLGGGRVVGVSNVNGPSYSIDHGVTWVAGGGLSGSTLMNDLAWSPELATVVATDLTLGSLIRSYDLGATWFAQSGSNPTGATWTVATWASTPARFYFAGGLGDGAAQIMTTAGGNPNMAQTLSAYTLGAMTSLPNTVAYDEGRARVYCGAIGAESRFSNGTANLVATTTGATPAAVQASAVYSVARAAPADYPTRAATYFRSADTNLATRIAGVERPLAGPSVKISRRFDGTLAGQTFWASDAGGISFGWDAVNRQVRFTTTAANFYGSTTMVSAVVLNTTTTLPSDTYTSAILAAATVYYAANVAVGRVATWDMAAGGPFMATITLGAATLTTATIPVYTIRVMTTATGALGNITIERDCTF